MVVRNASWWLIPLCIVLLQPVMAETVSDQHELDWQRSWSERLFEQARNENKFILLDLEAVWCHWCHVMEQTTYRDERVVELLSEKYITVRIDQDSDPDLLARYGDYGWPATIVFAADGSEIVKRRGYINPRVMASMLQAIIDDPSPGPSVIARQPVRPSATPTLSDAQQQQLQDRYFDLYDAENGGWGFIHKFIDADAMDYALRHAHRGSKVHEIMARQTLHAALDLIDPVWGGVYQYSDRLDWSSPHYEKIMSSQTQYLRLYSLAWSLWSQDNHRAAADAIYDYLNRFLRSPKGVFYTSQDADLNDRVDGKTYYSLAEEQRLELGMPRIDKTFYTRENAWIIRAFVAYANATGDSQSLDLALGVAEKLEHLMGTEDGGFRHGLNDQAGPYLSDSLAMGAAYLSLYQATGNQHWLRRSIRSLQFIDKQFRDAESGYFNSQVHRSAVGVFATAIKQRDENIQLARIANLAYHCSGDKSLLNMHNHAMKYMTSDDIIEDRFFLAGLLLAAEEKDNAPIHITIVGAKNDPSAIELHSKARTYPVDYLRVDWLDRRAGRLMNDDIKYPELPRSAAFACSENSCSLPIFTAERLHTEVDKLLQPVAMN